MKRHRFYSLVLALFIACLGFGAEIKVESVGRSPADRPDARERALTDALRDAIRKGAGVKLVGNTEIRNHQLQEDFMYTWSTGYIRDYTVLDSREFAGLLEVTVEAMVSDTPLSLDDKTLVKLLVERRRTPRLQIRTEANVRQLQQQPDVNGLLTEMAQEYGFAVIDTQALQEGTDLRSARDRLLGNDFNADARALNRGYDFVITCRVTGAYEGQGKTYGLPNNRYSLATELIAYWPETGEVITQVSIEPTRLGSTVSDPAMGAQESLRRLLQQRTTNAVDQNQQITHLEDLIYGIMAKWTTELDLGTRTRVEFLRIPRTQLTKLIGELPKVQSVNRVWERQFDAQLSSIIEVETRLDAGALAAEIQRILPDWGADRVAGTGLQFRRQAELDNPVPGTVTPPVVEPVEASDPAEQSTLTQSATSDTPIAPAQPSIQINMQQGQEKGEASSSQASSPNAAATTPTGEGAVQKGGMPAWLWAVIGAVVVLGLVGLILLLVGGTWLVARRGSKSN